MGILQSLSGTMSISEVTVKNSDLLAIEEINAAGGVLGKKAYQSSRTVHPTGRPLPRRPRS